MKMLKIMRNCPICLPTGNETFIFFNDTKSNLIKIISNDLIIFVLLVMRANYLWLFCESLVLIVSQNRLV